MPLGGRKPGGEVGMGVRHFSFQRVEPSGQAPRIDGPANRTPVAPSELEEPTCHSPSVTVGRVAQPHGKARTNSTWATADSAQRRVAMA